MLCPHCRHLFHDNEHSGNLYWNNTALAWLFHTNRCPGCDEIIVDITSDFNTTRKRRFRAYPIGTSRSPVPAEVPSEIGDVYSEACIVLAASTRASAALSRRCLQQILHAHGYVARTLDQEIQALLKEPDPLKAIPLALRDTIDVIRNFGNFGAHPMTDVTSLQIIDVEPEEAEWCLEILEAMFQHFYVAPATAKARKVALDAKLKAAGKPPSK